MKEETLKLLMYESMPAIIIIIKALGLKFFVSCGTQLVTETISDLDTLTINFCEHPNRNLYSISCLVCLRIYCFILQ